MGYAFTVGPALLLTEASQAEAKAWAIPKGLSAHLQLRPEGTDSVE